MIIIINMSFWFGTTWFIDPVASFLLQHVLFVCVNVQVKKSHQQQVSITPLLTNQQRYVGFLVWHTTLVALAGEVGATIVRLPLPSQLCRFCGWTDALQCRVSASLEGW